MKNVLTILGKEIRSYFASPVAYGVMAFFALLTGYFFYAYVAIFVARGVQSQMMGQGMPMDVNEWVIRPLLMNISVIGLFLIPMITMRLFAEEKRSGTIELLATSPVRDIEIIVGKWLSALVLYGGMLIITAVCVLTLFFYGKPDWPPILTGYLGLLLQGGALLALGTFLSTTTRNQIVAAVATFGVSLMLWVMDWSTSIDPSSAWSKAMAYLSVITHLEPFTKGVIDSKDVVFFISLTFLGLFLTARSMESLRWRA
jgi:ABC-2 type transport system permease protein